MNLSLLDKINKISIKYINFINKWLIGIILIIVATIQITLSFSKNLSPWKGGGFGMFSTIDSPSMRVVSVRGFDSDGNQYMIDAASVLNLSEKKSLRSFPQRIDFIRLAENLITEEFVLSNSHVLKTYELLKAENPNIDFQISKSILIDQPRYRVRRRDDPKLLNNQVIIFEKIQLELWQLKFDEMKMELWSQAMFEPINVERLN